MALRDFADASANLNKHSQSKIRKSFSELLDSMRGLEVNLDPVREPKHVFDPGDPKVIGGFIGIAMLAQEKVPLGLVEPFYGSGIYAVYFQGKFPEYQPLSGTEHPIYVGKADPTNPKAKVPKEQGRKLFDRLKDHARTIGKASTTLSLDDFTCRYLVVQSGWETAAEKFLIGLFKPAWNSETGICYGIGKHGDSPDTRGNKRSPWDTMHLGRDWAHRDQEIEDQIPIDEIQQSLQRHFTENPPFKDEAGILKHFFGLLRQG